MRERQNTILCAFDLRSRCILTYEIHERIYAQISYTDYEITMVQIDGPKPRVWIKFRDNGRMQDVLHSTGGHVEYRHTNGDVWSPISTAAMGTRRVCIANLTPEVLDGVLQLVLSGCREVMDIQAESWSRLYRYPLANGMWLAMIITLAKHILLWLTTECRWYTVSNMWRVMVVMHVSPFSIVPDAMEITWVSAHIHPYVMDRYGSGDRRHLAGPWGRR